MITAILRPPGAARRTSSGYRFQGARGRVVWPMVAGERMGAAGCWNFAWRIGAIPREVDPPGVAALGLDDVLLAALDPDADDATRGAIATRVERGGWVVASGASASWTATLPGLFTGTSTSSDNPYAGLAYRINSAVQLVAPVGWPVHVYDSIAADQVVGQTAYVSGERQTPRHATVRPVADAPAMLRRGRFVFLNGSPFHALQAWLQGQEDLQPWLAWRDRLFWLDEWVSVFKSLLDDAGVPTGVEAARTRELPAVAVVLRHDLDYSRDTSYLQAEVAAGVPAVHAVLRDSNTDFWRGELSKHPTHEVGFHYNTARHSRLETGLRRMAGLAARAYAPARSEVVANGLMAQVRWAKKSGIGVATLHRHLSFLIYPEWVDAFDAVTQARLGVRGGSSMFRAQVLRWGGDRADGGRGSYADHPDVMFPFWMPFRLAHAGDGGRIVDGWESASLMEAEPEMVERVLDHRTPGLPHRVVTLNYHPAHATRPTFAARGSLANFLRVLSIVRERGIPVVTLRGVYEALNRRLGPGT